MELRRVVITGIGAVTPIGNDAETFWASLLAGKSGIGPITHFDASKHPVRVAGEIKGFDPTEVMDHRAARRSGRFAQIALKAAKEALVSAKIEMDRDRRPRRASCSAAPAASSRWGARRRSSTSAARTASTR